MSTPSPLLKDVVLTELQERIVMNNLKIEVIGNKIRQLQHSLELEFLNGTR